ncbi:MAG: hypothetical protein JRJ03_18395 [Deltaproteobacteria bacterium]|nr:hypothetical protein [Deltaproteobacteria bacterium]
MKKRGWSFWPTPLSGVRRRMDHEYRDLVGREGEKKEGGPAARRFTAP